MTGYVTRIAPSPTGTMHIGTARTALFNWLAARASGGKFILRIDDTDADRNDDSHVQVILDSMAWLGLDYDAMFRQSDTAGRTKAAADLLVSAGYATVLDNGAIALKWHEFMPRTWTDAIAGDMTITDDAVGQIDGLILVRGGDKLGQPTYQFASVLDDYLSGVNYIIRGTDHISNTGKQVAIWAALSKLDGKADAAIADAGLDGFATRDPALPKFAHVGLIHKDKKKMSKRDGAASLLDYRDADYDVDAIFNFLLRMGWGPTVDNKSTSMLNRDDAVRLFLDGGRMKASPANFDQQILDAYNRKWKARKATVNKEN